MGVYKRDDAWGIQYFHNGKRVRKMIGPNKKTAEAVLNRIQLDIRAGRYTDDELRVTTIEELCDLYLSRFHGKSKYDEERFVSMIRDYFAGRKVHEITTDDVENF